MTTLVTICFVLAATATCGAGWLWFNRPPCVRQRVIVNLKAEQDCGYAGVLWSTWGPWVTLKQVTAHKVGSQPAPVDGDAVFHRDAILFMQVLPGGEG